jgi:hypothetical protein
MLVGNGSHMQILLRAVLYFWLLTGFAVSYLSVIDLDTVGMFWFFIIWFGGALVMGWIGDAVIFGRGTVFGRSGFGAVGKSVYVAVIVLLPLINMLAE